jgi:hypothetical protein
VSHRTAPECTRETLESTVSHRTALQCGKKGLCGFEHIHDVKRILRPTLLDVKWNLKKLRETVDFDLEDFSEIFSYLGSGKPLHKQSGSDLDSL